MVEKYSKIENEQSMDVRAQESINEMHKRIQNFWGVKFEYTDRDGSKNWMASWKNYISIYKKSRTWKVKEETIWYDTKMKKFHLIKNSDSSKPESRLTSPAIRWEMVIKEILPSFEKKLIRLELEHLKAEIKK